MVYKANAEPKSSTKNEDLKELMELTGAGQLGIQVMEQLIASFNQGNTGIPDKFWGEFMAEVNANELVELVIPIYGKYLTHNDVKQLIRFYKRPVGKKLIEVQPMIMQESMMIGQEWGLKIAEKVVKSLKDKGY
jgi:hypothetical protein|tara:strand:+ start:422 stop:823 length:402 start_codon:yes stop_codon:yes gene_type:complete